MYEIYVSNSHEERLLLKTEFRHEFESKLHELLYDQEGYYVDESGNLWYASRARNEKDYNLIDFMAIAEISGFIPCK